MKYFIWIILLILGLLCWAVVRGGDCDPDWYDEVER